MLFNKFNRIINGDLRPHLISENDLTKLIKELTSEFYVDKDGKFKFKDEDYSLTFKEGDKIILESKDENDLSKGFYLKRIEDENFEDLVNINIPPPPNEKAGKYEDIIDTEKEIIICKIKNFLNEAKDIENTRFFVSQNIQILKDLARDLNIYNKKLKGDHGNLFTSDANHFVTYLMEYTLMELIQTIQITFKEILNLEIESENELKRELFEYKGIPYIFNSIDTFIRLPSHPKYIQLHQDYKNQVKQSQYDVPIGEFLYKFYKKESVSLKTDELRIKYFELVLNYWGKLKQNKWIKVIRNDFYVDDPEIVKILIPLIEKDLEMLKSNNLINCNLTKNDYLIYEPIANIYWFVNYQDLIIDRLPLGTTFIVKIKSFKDVKPVIENILKNNDYSNDIKLILFNCLLVSFNDKLGWFKNEKGSKFLTERNKQFVEVFKIKVYLKNELKLLERDYSKLNINEKPASTIQTKLPSYTNSSFWKEIDEEDFVNTLLLNIQGICMNNISNEIDTILRDYFNDFKAKILDLLKRLDQTEKQLFINSLVKQTQTLEKQSWFTNDESIRKTLLEYNLKAADFISELNNIQISDKIPTKQSKISFKEANEIIKNISHNIDSKAFDLKNNLEDLYFIKQKVSINDVDELMKNEHNEYKTKLLKYYEKYPQIIKEITLLNNEEINDYKIVEDLLFKLNGDQLFYLNEPKILEQVQDDFINLLGWYNYSQFLNRLELNIKEQKRSFQDSSTDNILFFQTNLNTDQLKELFKHLINEKYIAKTNEENFLQVFGKISVQDSFFEPLKWLLLNDKAEPHKTALREFLTVVIGKAPNQQIINSCITDVNGKIIKLAKPKKEANTEYWTDIFKAMIK